MTKDHQPFDEEQFAETPVEGEAVFVAREQTRRAIQDVQDTAHKELYTNLKKLPMRSYQKDAVGFLVEKLSDSSHDALISDCKAAGLGNPYRAQEDDGQLWLIIRGKEALTRLADNGVNFHGSSHYLSKSL